MALPAWAARLDAETKAKGVDLSKTGFADAAWPIAVHGAVVRTLGDCKLAILEGDILRRDHGQFEHTFEGWHCDLNRGESWPSFIERSCAVASEYLSGLEDQSDLWFTVTVSVKPSAAQRAKKS